MGILKRAITSVSRNFGKTTLLISIIILLGTLLSVAISVNKAFYQTDARLRERLPSVAVLEFIGDFDDVERNATVPNMEMIEAVASLSYVRDYDINSMGFLRAPLTYANIPINPSWSDELRLAVIESYEDLLSIHENDPYLFFSTRGTHAVKPTHEQAGIIKLEDGRFMTELEHQEGLPVALVSNGFAEVNHLSVGDTIQLENIAQNQQSMTDYIFENGDVSSVSHLDQFIAARMSIEFEIIGIFSVADDLIPSDTTFVDFTLLSARELVNTIFIPHTLQYELDQFIREHMIFHDEFPQEFDFGFVFTPFFILEDPRDFPAFSQAAAEVIPEYWRVVDTSGSFAPFSRSMDTMLWVAELIFWGSLIAIVVVLSLVITLFVRDRKHEIGVYRALGESRMKILMQMMIEVLGISLLAMILALFIGNVLSTALSRQILEKEIMRTISDDYSTRVLSEDITFDLEIFDPGPMTIEEMLEAYDVTLDTQTIVAFFGFGILAISISTMLPIVYIMRLDPKEILLS